MGKPPERKLITVLHLDYDNPPRGLLYEATFHGAFKSVVELYNMGYYRKVAVVLCDSLSSAFALTQGTGCPGKALVLSRTKPAGATAPRRLVISS